MEDPRWDDPTKVPLSNGPFSQTTPPTRPNFVLVQDGQLIEFLLPYPMHITDLGPWKPLDIPHGQWTLKIEKPIPVIASYSSQGQIGNESPDAHSCIIRVVVNGKQTAYPVPQDVWPQVEQLVSWMRVKGRHHWLLHGQTGFGTTFRGSVMTRADREVRLRNVVAYGRNVIIRPIDEKIWLSLAKEVVNQTELPVADSIFCDALSSAVSGDIAKTILELGVASEVDLTQLLVATANQNPATLAHQEFLQKKGDWRPFKEKLLDWTKRLGLDDPQGFLPTKIAKNWVTRVQELYLLRNGVAHSGVIPQLPANIAEYIFAVHALLWYCRDQRVKAVLPVFDFPVGQTLYEQLLCAKDGTFMGVTNDAVGIVN